jgi:hypothetical protein
MFTLLLSFGIVCVHFGLARRRVPFVSVLVAMWISEYVGLGWWMLEGVW